MQAIPSANAPAELLALFLAGVGGFLAAVFGRSNIGFLYVLSTLLVMEYLAVLASAALLPEEEHGVRQAVRHWIERFLLLMLIPLASSIDWTIYYVQPRELPLGESLHMGVTKAAFVGIIAYVGMRVVKIVAVFYRDMPLIDLLMSSLDRMKQGTDHPHRREYDQVAAKDGTTERRDNGEH